jgi:large subunit ribosomal protein L24
MLQRLRIGDLVQVTAGRDKGKRGKVTKLHKGDGRVTVEGLNMVVRHTRPNQLNTEGGRIEKEAPLALSNVMPIDADNDKPTRVKVVVDEEGKKRRVAISGAELKQG